MGEFFIFSRTLHCKSLDSCFYPVNDIIEALEKDVAEGMGVNRTYRVMVAAQYILIATIVLYKELSSSKGWDQVTRRWKLWARRFKEIADKGDLDPEVNNWVEEALEKMVSLDPAQLHESQEGPKPDNCEWRGRRGFGGGKYTSGKDRDLFLEAASYLKQIVDDGILR